MHFPRVYLNSPLFLIHAGRQKNYLCQYAFYKSLFIWKYWLKENMRLSMMDIYFRSRAKHDEMAL